MFVGITEAVEAAAEWPAIAPFPHTLAAASDSDGGKQAAITFQRIIVWPDGHKEIEGQTPKQLTHERMHQPQVGENSSNEGDERAKSLISLALTVRKGTILRTVGDVIERPRFDRIADRRAIKRGVKRGRLSIEITGTGFEFWAKDAKIRASFFISDSTKILETSRGCYSVFSRIGN